MKRIACFLLCMVMLSGLLAMPVLAAIFQVSYYEEAIYAGGILDLYAFPDNGGVEPYTYQWQFDAAMGGGHWLNLDDNDNYKGTKTNHLQVYTRLGNYEDWDQIPFQCAVTDAEGTTFYTPDIYMKIYPTDNLIPNLKAWGYGLYEPTITNVAGFSTGDYVNYTASTFAGSKLNISCGSKSIDDRAILRNSEVELTRQIHITENGHTTKVSDQTTYVPYTVGKNAVTVEIKLHLTIGQYDLGDLDCKTIKLSTSKPTVTSTATTNSACSLLRYTYNESQKLVSIPKGATVEVLGKEGSYYQVFYNNYVGYVGTSLLNVQQPSYDPVIKDVDVTITKPVAGEKPSFTCKVLTEGCQLYKTDPVTWTDAQTGRIVSANETFQEGRSYNLSIWVAAKSGYKFQVDASYKPKLTGSINGDLPPFINKAYEQDPEEVIELTYTFNNVKAKEPEQTHTCSPVLVKRVEPTCTEKGKQAYYRCSCGMHYKDAAGTQSVNISTWGDIPATGHTPSPWRTTQVYHYTACTTCGEMLQDEDHYGGEATCTEKGKCTVCGYAYIEENEVHTPDTSKWISRPGMYHFHACKYCGAHCDIEDHCWSPKYHAVDATGHAYQCADCMGYDIVIPHNPGPEATDTEPQTCTDCGYIIAPAINHTHDLSRVPQTPADCTQGGNIEYYFCTGCNDCFTDAQAKNKIPETMSVLVEPLGHTPSDTWSCDGEYHWRICTACSAVLDETKMLHEDANSDRKCDSCACALGEDTIPETTGNQNVTDPDVTTGKPDAPEDQTSEKPKENRKDNSWLPVVMIALVCFGASTTAAVIILKKKQGEKQ